MFESRTPRSYDHLLSLSDAERSEAGQRLTAYLRTLPSESGKNLYREQRMKMLGLSTKVGANYKERNDFKRTLPEGLIGIRRVIEPGRLTDEFQVILQPLEVIVVGVDYDRAEAILEDGSHLTFPPIFVASPEELQKVQEQMSIALREIISKSGN